MQRVRGVEPLSLAWKAKVIPIYDTRMVGVLRIGLRLYAPKAHVLPLYDTPNKYIF